MEDRLNKNYSVKYYQVFDPSRSMTKPRFYYATIEAVGGLFRSVVSNVSGKESERLHFIRREVGRIIWSLEGWF